MRKILYNLIAVGALLFASGVGLWNGPKLAYGHEWVAAGKAYALAIIGFGGAIVWVAVLVWRRSHRHAL